MIIGFDAKRAFINRSGLGNYSRDVIRSLHEFFPENNYVLFSAEKETELLEKEYTRNIVSPKAKSKPGKSYWRSFSIIKDIEKQNLDVYHGLSNELPFGIEKLKLKKVVTIHDLIFLEIPGLYPVFDRKIYRKKVLHACKSADKIIATSEQTKSDIIKHFGIREDKIVVIYQSCNQIFTKPVDNTTANNVLSKYNLKNDYMLNVGTLEVRKNALNILKAVYYFNIKTDIVFVGKKTAYYKDLKKYIDTHEMNDRVHFLSNVSTQELAAVYQRSKLFIYPSLYEGFGIPIVEAFSSGVPVITSDSGSPAEIGGDAAIQVEALNSKSIGIAIRSILDSPELAQNLIREGKQRSKLFERETVSLKLNNFYKSL